MFSKQLATAERDRLVKKIRTIASLSEAGEFAVRDAVTFSGCIAAGKEDEVLARASGITEAQRPDVLQVAIPKVKRKDEVSSPAIEEMRLDKEERARALQEKFEREREARESARSGIGSIGIRRTTAVSPSSSAGFDLSAFLTAPARLGSSRRTASKAPEETTATKESSINTSKEKHLKETWSLDEIKRIADDVEQKRAAECQSFAAYLVAKLKETLDSEVRIQIVAHRDKKGLGTHNYVLINFAGDDLSYDELEKQKTTVLIGDLWLLALGHDQVKDEIKNTKSASGGIYTFNQYPIDHVMLKDLVEIYDSKKIQLEEKYR